jgi:hypothetical protein
MLVNDDFTKPLNKQILDEFIVVASDDVVKVIASNYNVSSYSFVTIGTFVPKRNGALRIKIIMQNVGSSSKPATIRCLNSENSVLATIEPSEESVTYNVDFNVSKNKTYTIQCKENYTGYADDIIQTLSICGNVRFGEVVE